MYTKMPKIKCLICSKKEDLQIDSWADMNFRLPNRWMMRANWGELHPTKFQAICNNNKKDINSSWIQDYPKIPDWCPLPEVEGHDKATL